MLKIILASLAGLLVLSGTVGASAALAEGNMEKSVEALQTWSRQILRTQGKLQDREQLHIQNNEAIEGPELPLQLQTQTQLQLQDRELLQLKYQAQIHLDQGEGLQITERYQWMGDSSNAGNGVGIASGQDQVQQNQNRKGEKGQP